MRLPAPATNFTLSPQNVTNLERFLRPLSRLTSIFYNSPYPSSSSSHFYPVSTSTSTSPHRRSSSFQSRLLHIAKELPLIFVISLLIWTYYSHFISLTLHYTLLTHHRHLKGFLIGVGFHLVWVGCCWSLGVTVLRGPGKVMVFDDEFVEEGGRGMGVNDEEMEMDKARLDSGIGMRNTKMVDGNKFPNGFYRDEIENDDHKDDDDDDDIPLAQQYPPPPPQPNLNNKDNPSSSRVMISDGKTETHSAKEEEEGDDEEEEDDDEDEDLLYYGSNNRDSISAPLLSQKPSQQPPNRNRNSKGGGKANKILGIDDDLRSSNSSSTFPRNNPPKNLNNNSDNNNNNIRHRPPLLLPTSTIASTSRSPSQDPLSFPSPFISPTLSSSPSSSDSDSSSSSSSHSSKPSSDLDLTTALSLDDTSIAKIAKKQRRRDKKDKELKLAKKYGNVFQQEKEGENGAKLDQRPLPERGGGFMSKGDGGKRFCRKCRIPKPDRAHHCSSCGVCALKMDHHCPWLGGRCVGIKNHKPFLLFLFYVTLVSLFCCVDGSLAALEWLETAAANTDIDLAPLNYAFLAFIGGIVFFSVGGFFIWHLILVFKNQTTIESIELSSNFRVKLPPLPSLPPPPPSSQRRSLMREDGSLGYQRYSFDEDEGEDERSKRGWGHAQGQSYRHIPRPFYKSDDMLDRDERKKLEKAAKKYRMYDLGWKRNWLEVFGDDWRWWAFPIGRSPGDGYSFPINQMNLLRLQQVTRQVRLSER